MRNKLIVLGIVVVVLGVLAANALFVVHQTQQALVLQFGEPKQVIREPGLKVKIPFIQNVVYYDNRTLDLDPPGFEVLLTDRKRIQVDAYARYRITDPLRFFQRVRAESILRDRYGTIINSSLRRIIARTSLRELLSEQRDTIMRDIENEVRALGEGFGVTLVEIRIGRTELPTETRQAVFDRMRTEREREARELRAEGSELGRKIRAQADFEKTVLLADAERTSRILRGEGEGERNRILGEAFSRDVAFFDFYKSLEEYQRSMADHETTLVLSPDSDFFRFFGSDGARVREAQR